MLRLGPALLDTGKKLIWESSVTAYPASDVVVIGYRQDAKLGRALAAVAAHIAHALFFLLQSLTAANRSNQ
jgi:hypothetical protein